ncbi:MAG: hypothetical protein GVY19_08425 [Bacteroidetes bacterium]|jgi:hypothetical protein|nr:hypothetical protein [Bacteroidota bacterium]
MAKNNITDQNYHEQAERQKLVTLNKIIGLISAGESLKETLQKICQLIPGAYTYPKYVKVRLTFQNLQFVSDDFQESGWVEKEPITATDDKSNMLEIYFTREYLELANHEFLNKSPEFIQHAAQIISGFISKNHLEKLSRENKERIKELTGISRTAEILKQGRKLEESLQEICHFLPEAWQYPQYAAAKIVLDDKTFKSRRFKETPWVQKQSFETFNNKKGCIEIYYLKELPEEDEGPFLKEERKLLDNLTALISGTVSTKGLQQLLHDNSERLKELRGINQTSAVLKKGKSMDESLRDICYIIPEAWQYPEHTVARISYEKKVFTSPHFKETKWCQKQDFRTPGNKKGTIEVFYLKKFPEAYEGPFLKEERNLLINLANLIAGTATKNIFNNLLNSNRERLKELKAINQTSSIIAEGRPVDETLQKIVNILPGSWQYPKKTVARIYFEEKYYTSPDFRETKWSQKENFVTIDSKKGTVEIYYLKAFPKAYEGPFLKEERHLLINIAKLISGYLNHYKGRDIIQFKNLLNRNEKYESKEFRKSFIQNKRPLQLFFNQQVIDKYIYLDMMKYKVKEILFVATLYDAYILENENNFFEQFMGEIYQYSLFSLPRITGVTSEEEAMEILDTKPFDLVILMVSIDTTAPLQISKKIKEKEPNLPIYLLLNNQSHVKNFEELVPATFSIDKLFVWQGHSQIFFSIVKSIEDAANVENDTQIGLVRIILLIEDSAEYYSRYLQILYSIVFEQIQKLLPEVEKNELDKICKMRSRPKILHARNYEEAIHIYNKYKDFMLCVISDIEFEREGKFDRSAGLRFIKNAKSQTKHIPFILQSSDNNYAAVAGEAGAHFINKNANSLHNDLKNFLTNYIYFGDFVFKDTRGEPIASAKSLREFETLLHKIPDESIYTHAMENQFSLWLMARGEIELARHTNPVKVSDFNTVEDFRNYFIQAIKKYKEEKKRGKVLSFDETSILDEKNIISFSGGSFGGKGRGVAFINALINNLDLSDISSGINIRMPLTAIIGTDEFKAFMNKNNLWELIFEPGLTYEEIKQQFTRAKLSSQLVHKLGVFLDQVDKPVAVRSSSLSEDSLTQPFAGVFDTYIIPNNQKSKKARLEELSKAIKLVYASVYSVSAKTYFRAIGQKIEEERMAVILQELVGNQHDQYYYPHISGTAQSYNYYAMEPMKPKDGVANIAIGLGDYVVSGNKSYRFSPKHPGIDVYTTKDLLHSTQVEFYAVDLSNKSIDLLKNGEHASMTPLDINTAIAHGIIKHCISTYNPDNDRIEAGTAKPGPRIVNFANILRFNYTPLAQTIHVILNMVQEAFGSPVEIEFAVDLNKTVNQLPSFYLLQIKPLLNDKINEHVNLEKINPRDCILYSKSSLGNGIISDVKDIIHVDINRFDKLKTTEMAKEIQELNEYMVQQNKRYILIGPGRWGTRERFLGIPVNWSQISNARVIVEISLANYPLDASLGSHFFHNITSMDIGYLSVLDSSSEEFIQWDMINQQPLVQETKYFKHVRFDQPLHIYMNGKQRTSAIAIK